MMTTAPVIILVSWWGGRSWSLYHVRDEDGWTLCGRLPAVRQAERLATPRDWSKVCEVCREVVLRHRSDRG